MEGGRDKGRDRRGETKKKGRQKEGENDLKKQKKGKTHIGEICIHTYPAKVPVRRS